MAEPKTCTYCDVPLDDANTIRVYVDPPSDVETTFNIRDACQSCATQAIQDLGLIMQSWEHRTHGWGEKNWG